MNPDTSETGLNPYRPSESALQVEVESTKQRGRRIRRRIILGFVVAGLLAGVYAWMTIDPTNSRWCVESPGSEECQMIRFSKAAAPFYMPMYGLIAGWVFSWPAWLLLRYAGRRGPDKQR